MKNSCFKETQRVMKMSFPTTNNVIPRPPIAVEGMLDQGVRKVIYSII